MNTFFHRYIRQASFSLAAGIMFTLVPLTPLRAMIESDTAFKSLWQESSSVRSAASDVTLSFATDHILIKRVGQPVEQVVVAANESVRDVLEYWKEQSDIEYAELDGLVHAAGQQTSWGWTAISADSAASVNGATGAGIVVAVIDTGVDYEHEDLDANNWVNTGEVADNNLDDDGNGFVDDVFGYDFIGSFYTSISPDSDPQDEYGHGTHVAGIVAAENNSVGVRGVAPSATIMPVKVLDAVGVGFDSTVADGIRYATDNGAHIINLSLGSFMATHTIQNAVDYAETNGVLVIAAAGNSYSFMFPSYPANYSNVVSVAASNEDGYKAWYSNWGKVDVMAPGDDILSSTPGDTYARYSGTSMATPHVAGVAALIMQDSGSTNLARTRQILETTTDDFGMMSGPDYVSGQGMINALSATNDMTSGSALVFADSGKIISDASDSVTLTVSVRNAAGAAIVGDSVSWSTDTGTLSAASSTTNSAGQATITLTADDTAGLTTITADPASTAAGTIQIVILDDTVQPENFGISNYVVETAEDDFYDFLESAPDQMVSAVSTDGYFTAGEDVVIWAYPYIRDKQLHDVTLSYSVTDEDNTVITELSGTTAEVRVGVDWGFWFFPQQRIGTKPLTLPDTLENGRYTLSVTITDLDSSESATDTTYFWVGQKPKILIVDNQSACGDVTVDDLSYLGMISCSQGGNSVQRILADAGHEAVLWNDLEHGSVTAELLNTFSTVIWLDSFFGEADTYIIQSYLDAGGNLLMSSDALEWYPTSNPSSFLWEYMHAKVVSNLTHPTKVTGVAGGPFESIEYNTDFFNLNGDGAHNNFNSKEIELNDADDAEAIFQYEEGASDAKVAGLRVATDTYRAVYLGFSLEAINDTSGDATKFALLTDLVDWLNGSKPAISTFSPKKVQNNQNRTITITGERFHTVGTTKVYLGRRQLSGVWVLDANTILAMMPVDFPTGQYRIKVVRPDGRKIRSTTKIKVTNGGPFISELSKTVISNHKIHRIMLTGSHFRQNSLVLFGKQEMSEVEFFSPYQLRVTVPIGYEVGDYKVTVRNKNGKSGSLKKQKVRVRFGFTKNAFIGDSGDAINALEERLVRLGYFTDTPDQNFQINTANALRLYQQAKLLPVTGKLDFLTRTELNK